MQSLSSRALLQRWRLSWPMVWRLRCWRPSSCSSCLAARCLPLRHGSTWAWSDRLCSATLPLLVQRLQPAPGTATQPEQRHGCMLGAARHCLYHFCPAAVTALKPSHCKRTQVRGRSCSLCLGSAAVVGAERCSSAGAVLSTFRALLPTGLARFLKAEADTWHGCHTCLSSYT